MSAKNMMWVSVITLIISIVTLALVWQTRAQLAHTETQAAYTGPNLDQRKLDCTNSGGVWSVTEDNPDGGQCAKKPYKYIYDAQGRLTEIK